MGDVAGDVDIRAADVESIEVHHVPVAVGDFGLHLVGVVREDRGPNLDARRVVWWRVACSGCHLGGSRQRRSQQGGSRERQAARPEQSIRPSQSVLRAWVFAQHWNSTGGVFRVRVRGVSLALNVCGDGLSCPAAPVAQIAVRSRPSGLSDCNFLRRGSTRRRALSWRVRRSAPLQGRSARTSRDRARRVWRHREPCQPRPAGRPASRRGPAAPPARAIP